MSIYRETQGRGQDVFLIHGWGMGGNVWESLAAKLRQRYRVTIVDLPGYGRSAHYALPEYNLQSLAGELISLIRPDAASTTTVVGWSLGGLIAMQMALAYPNVFDRLVLVAASPQFQRSGDWPHAVDGAILQNFAAALTSSYQQTIQQFLAIQALGSDYAREEIRLLRGKVFRDGEPDKTALRKSLEILQTTNLRGRLHGIGTDTLIIAGERDRLVPAAAAKQLAQRITGSQLRVIKGAGHAPFISHQDRFIATLEEFLPANP